ncbi:9377_t:CDS:10 [Diversispora eburnea]|uniref:9377_t:CDS:1 n=1 Tax=Diversispora eburnea TaxID=1213867 RepID=A0A9N8YLA8_9GLOM|nr:9377_t:CDS:10 [Diversispora eburnea]
MDSYSSLPSMNQQQQGGYAANSLQNNPALLQQQQQTQPQQYTNNFNSQLQANQANQSPLNMMSEQSQHSRNYGTINNRNIQQLGDNGANIANQYIFQNRQSLPATSANQMPPISAINNPVYNNNSNMLNYQSQGNINGMGLDFPQHNFNRALGQMPTGNDVPTKKTNSSSTSVRYEPAPDLTPVQKQYLEQYVRRDILYQRALELQMKRQTIIVIDKRTELTQAEHRHRLSSFEIDGADGYKLRDTFTWNMNETFITPEHFAEVLCDDLRFPSSTFVPLIVKQMRDQIQGYILNPLHSTEPTKCKLDVDAFANLIKSSDNVKLDIVKCEDDNNNESTLLNNNLEDSIIHEELRILIKIDVTVGNISLVDQFEWDINCPKNDPELFAEILTTELGLGGEFKTAIAHAIREQVQIYVKSLILVGHPFDGSPVQDDDLRQSFLPPITNIIRKEDSVDQHTPILVELTEAEIDKIEKDRERDARRKRRQTRGRRGVILPDREPPKTHRTLLHNTITISDPTDETGFLTVLSSGMPPVQRKASSMGYDNYSAISEKASTSSSGKVKGRGRTGANVGSNLRGGIQVNTPDFTDINSFGRSGSVGLSPPKESKEGTKKPHRRTAKNESEEWQCDGCGCSLTSTPLLRKGPNGEKTLCNACGKSESANNGWSLYFQKNNSLRPNPLNTNEVGTNLLLTENNSSSIASISTNSLQHIKNLQDNPVSYTQSMPTTTIGQNPSVRIELLDDQQSSNTLVEKQLLSQEEIKNQDNKNLIESSGISMNSLNPKIVITTPYIPNLISKATAPPTYQNTANSVNIIESNATATATSSNTTVPNVSLPNKLVFPEWIIQQRDQLQENGGNNSNINIVSGSNYTDSDIQILGTDKSSNIILHNPSHEVTAVGVFIDNRNGIPQTQTSTIASPFKSKGP